MLKLSTIAHLFAQKKKQRKMFCFDNLLHEVASHARRIEMHTGRDIFFSDCTISCINPPPTKMFLNFSKMTLICTCRFQLLYMYAVSLRYLLTQVWRESVVMVTRNDAERKEIRAVGKSIFEKKNPFFYIFFGVKKGQVACVTD